VSPHPPRSTPQTTPRTTPRTTGGTTETPETRRAAKGSAGGPARGATETAAPRRPAHAAGSPPESRGGGDEKLSGIVERVTFHSAETGWSVLRVSPFGAPQSRVTVTLRQVRAFAGASMDFYGSWTQHPRFGEQFDCRRAVLRKPASAAALEKYLGSGLIAGVGPRTARRIVRHFGDDALDVLEHRIERLLEVRGIARRRLERIAGAWREHRAIRDVVLFLQEHDVSTHFAVKIFRAYGDAAIEKVREDPFRLARDIYGIGFFSADRIAASLGFAPDGAPRIEAGIRHVLAAAREQGHCFLTAEQVEARARELLRLEELAEPRAAGAVPVGEALQGLARRGEVRVRELPPEVAGAASAESATDTVPCYYSPTLYRDEETLARQVARRVRRRVPVDVRRVERWLAAWCGRTGLALSDEQRAAVRASAERALSVLTGGPGCGKTTAVRAMVALARARDERVTLAAPTGRASQRLAEVVGQEAGTIHRLLEWSPTHGRFTRDARKPLATDLVVVDETSMLDVSLGAALLAAVPPAARVVLVGDPGQLPAVGAGDVLADLLRSPAVPRVALREVFRQADRSDIVRIAHGIARGEPPRIPSPLARPALWDEVRAGRTDCLFLDAEEATAEQARFVRRASAAVRRTLQDGRERRLASGEREVGRLRRDAAGRRVEVVSSDATTEGRPEGAPGAADGGREPGGSDGHDAIADPAPEAPLETFSIPPRFLHVDLAALGPEAPLARQIREVLGRVHPHSALRRGLTLPDAVVRLYRHTLPRVLGPEAEVQILTPMNRGSAGADALNRRIQAELAEAEAPDAPSSGARGAAGADGSAALGAAAGTPRLVLGDRLLRPGDRVIQRRNDYYLGVFNGDIGEVLEVDPAGPGCRVAFGPLGRRDQIVSYGPGDLGELALAYAITVHKSQGSEFDAVIVPLVAQHHRMLFRGLVYTALTRARRLAIFVGERRALARAIRNQSAERRQTALTYRIGQATAEPGRGTQGADPGATRRPADPGRA